MAYKPACFLCISLQAIRRGTTLANHDPGAAEVS